MPNLIVIDTSTACCSVAQLVANKITSRSLATGRHNAQQVLPLLSEVITATKSGLDEVDAIAVMAGPGSFTGIRIGIGVAQGLSMANNTPVLPLSLLAVQAFAALQTTSYQQVLVSEVAREGEVYFAAYRRCPEAGVKLLGAEQVGAPADRVISPEHRTSADQWLAIGNGWQKQDDLLQALGSAVELGGPNPDFDIDVLCELAKLRFINGEALPAAQALPNYVKDTLDYER